MEETMGDSQNTDWTRTIAWQAGGSPPAQLAEMQKIALQQQQELLEDTQQRMAAWTRRRQVALETGIEALQRMSACNTPVAMAAICGEWVSGSITRILADLDDAQAHALKMADHFQKASKALFESQQVAPAKPAATPQPVVTEAQPQLREAAD
jgi:hypothetical protein